MKKTIGKLILITVALVSAIALSYEQRNKISSQRNVRPIETIIRQKSGDDEWKEQRERREWIEHMHRAAPGTDWRKIERDNRWAKYRQKLPAIRQRGAKTNLIKITGDTMQGYWAEKGSQNQSGRIHVADLDTGDYTIYCGSAGGNIWKGSFNGTGWTSLTDQFQMSNIIMVKVLSTNNGKRILVADGGKDFYYSDDDGITWDTAAGLTAIESWGNIKRALVMNDSVRTIYLLATKWSFINNEANTCIFKSLDSGASFTTVGCFGEGANGSPNEFDLWAPPYGDGPAYLLNENRIYYLDSTGNRVLISSFIVNSQGYAVLTGCKTTDSTFLYAYIDRDIYRSEDAGVTWTFQDSINKNPFYRTSFSSSATIPDQLFFGDYECYRSVDGGANWIKVNNWAAYYSSPNDKLHADIPSISSVVDRYGFEFQFICTDGGLYISDDLLVTVDNLSLNGLNVSQYYSVYTHKIEPKYIYLGSQDQGFQRSSADGGGTVNFNQVISGDYGHIVSSNDGVSIWMVYPGFADYYSNAASGTSTAYWDFNGTNPFWMPPLMADPVSPNICYLAGGYIGTSGSHIIRLTEAGGFMIESELPFDFKASSGGDISAMEYSRVDDSLWYVLTDNGRFYRSRDAGTTWTMTQPFAGPPGAHYFYGSDILTSAKDSATVFIAGSGYSNPAVYMSTDTGITFTALDSVLPQTLVHQLAIDSSEKYLFAASEAGAYMYSFTTGAWCDLAGTSAPDQTYWSVDYIPIINTVRFASYGRGIWDFVIAAPPDTTDTNTVFVQPIAPLGFNIYPNPTNEIVKIQFAIPMDRPVFTIYNIAGAMVKRERAPNVLRIVELDVADLNPGVYFIEIKSSSDSYSQKLIIY